MRKMNLLLLLLLNFCISTVCYAEEAVFAMGCFWSAEVAFRNVVNNAPLPGIKSLTVGYAGGTEPHPTYEKHAGYKEALKIDFDPKLVTYAQLLEVFWHNIDIFDNGGQFCDRGASYEAAIYYLKPQQEREAEISKDRMQKKFKQKIVTPILPFTTFYKAEDYHQNYQHKNSGVYAVYKASCERDKRLHAIWNEQELKNVH